METMFIELITDIFNDCFKALKWKKQGNNYRYISKDGLGKIINFQKSKWNTTECLEFFDKVENKDAFVEMLLSGVAQQYAETPVMHYGTCKLLVDMGYYKEIYDIIKSCGGEYFENLKKEIEEKIGN